MVLEDKLEKLVVIDGNSILNRAFYGIMSSKMLQTADGTYTNAVYGFLAIMFKLLEDIQPEYMVVAFDVKHPTKRHEMYKEYKGTRKGMPDELAAQMPIIKEVLEAMNIKVIEKEGYEADDILGTLAKHSEKKGIKVTLLTGDRDSFQLASDNITIRIPRTKGGKTETENFDRSKILEVYGIEPEKLIEVKGLMGDSSDNIPGVAGVGEKTALNLIKEFGSIDNIYSKLEQGEQVAKGKLKEKLENGKDMAILSRELGRIDVNAPIDKELSDFKVRDWDYSKVLELFKKLKFNRYIERFNLENNAQIVKEEKDIENLKYWNMEKVKDISYMFSGCTLINDVYALRQWDLRNIENACDMLYGCPVKSLVNLYYFKKLPQKPNLYNNKVQINSDIKNQKLKKIIYYFDKMKWETNIFGKNFTIRNKNKIQLKIEDKIIPICHKYLFKESKDF